MSNPQNSTVAENYDAPESAWARTRRILYSAFTGNGRALRFSQTRGVELVKEEFLKRKRVQDLITQMGDLPISPPENREKRG
ncbi:MAG: hypothetical protein MPK11_06155 [Gammaproteobacteria bacterium]|nr:hypothetical protein [Gammaproteobacteria bacterium]MDA7962575.1 hypothetical protein [Gammaproteobacteria bacterium]MDA7970340.1 hypothetical protein [Gammaproteobacteria bacterium]MDA7996219.1 hypothetical protein [Gammaproteobacteria bacterium]MDA8024519.1 hypothetical protein [Gammaproteobacteria bacterium]